MERTTARRDALLIFLTLLVAYVYVLPRWADWSQNSRLNLVRALVEQGTTSTDAYVANTGDYALFNGRTYTDKPPGLSLVAVPIYAALLPVIDHPRIQPLLARAAGGGALGATLNKDGTGLQTDKIRHFVALVTLTAATVAVPAAALGVLLWFALARLGFTRPVRLVVVLAYGLATPAAAYAGNFYSHQFVAALLFGAFALLLGASDLRQASAAGSNADRRTAPAEATPKAARSWRAALFAPRLALGPGRGLLFGFLCGYALISEYPPALIIAAFGIYALLRLRPADLAYATLGGLPPLALMAWYNLASFGTIWPVGYAHSALWQDQHHTGFMSITYPHLDALWGLMFGSFRGLFIRAPWLLLALPGYVLWWRAGLRRGLWWVCLAASVLLTLFYASSVMWWGGFGVGPRYLVPMLPFLALAAAFAVQMLWARRAGRMLVLGLALISAALTWAETLAGQSFPTDAIRQPWISYTMPAWASGNIARNLGTALGLPGSLSLLPLALLLAVLILLLIYVPRPRRPAGQNITAEPNTTVAA
jgi:hypothetical protein